MTTNETKQCNSCGTARPLTSFYKNKGGKDGLQAKCKTCEKSYYNDNRVHILENRKAYRQANKEQLLKQMKVYRQENTEVISDYHKARWASMTKAERAAIGSVGGARRRSDLSSDVFYGGLTYIEACEMTVPFAELRLKLEQETGVAHNIDHKVPISAGGTHTSCNLQVVTAEVNLAKSAEDKLLVTEYKTLEPR